MIDGTGTTTYTYDGARRLISTTMPLSGKVVSYIFDGSGRPQTTTVDGWTRTATYDAATLRLSFLSLSPSTAGMGAVNYAYNADGTVRQIGAIATTNDITYDSRSRITSAGSPISKSNYTYDAAGRVLTKVDIRGSSVTNTTYTHDDADRLLTETRTGGPSGNGSVTYEYDAQGNRTKVIRDGVTYLYGAALDNDQFTTGEGHTFSNYDADGNPGTVAFPGGLTWTLTYDENSKPLIIDKSDGTRETFVWDGDGRRVRSTRGTTTAVGTTYDFVYDGAQVVLEIITGKGARTIQYVPGVGYKDSTIANFIFENHDALGSVIDTRVYRSNISTPQIYDAYGLRAYGSSLPGETRRGWAGKHGYQEDRYSGMHLLGARFYVARLGRFLTQDPIGHDGGLNLYSYCDNSPLTRIDPDGKDWIKSLTESVSRVYKSIAGSPMVRSWSNAMGKTLDWATGRGPRTQYYGPGSFESEQMRRSGVGSSIGTWITTFDLTENKYYGSEFFFKDIPLGGHMYPLVTTLMEFGNGTQAQVGGYQWRFKSTPKGYLVTVRNYITVKSLLLQFGGSKADHITIGGARIPGRIKGFGPFSDVKQTFEFYLR